MDPRVASIAEGALHRMGGDSVRTPEGALHLGTLSLDQLSDLAALRVGDPLAARVVQALLDGTPVSLDRGRVEADLGLAKYPPQLRAQFERWFSRIAGMGVTVVNGSAYGVAPSTAPSGPVCEDPPKPTTRVAAASPPFQPERQVFEAILGAADPTPHPCFLEPGKPCAGCSGRCRTLGF